MIVLYFDVVKIVFLVFIVLMIFLYFIGILFFDGCKTVPAKPLKDSTTKKGGKTVKSKDSTTKEELN